MSESKNNTANTSTETKAWSTAASELIAAHPHIVGLSVAAVAGALSHFYYGHSPLTVAAWAAAGLITGEALARILAHAQKITEAAASAKATAEALKAAAAAMPVFVAAQAAANAKINDLEEELKKLRLEHAAAAGAAKIEASEAAAFRAEVLKAKAAEEGKKPKAA